MRRRAVVLMLFLVASTFAAALAVAPAMGQRNPDEADPDESGGADDTSDDTPGRSEDAPGRAKNASDPSNASEPSDGSDSPGSSGSGSDKGSDRGAANRSARGDASSSSKGSGPDRGPTARGSDFDEDLDEDEADDRSRSQRETRGRAVDRLPAQVRDRLGAFTFSDGALEGRYVSLHVDRDGRAFADLTRDQLLLLDALVFPADADLADAHLYRTPPSGFVAEGAGWKVSLTDATDVVLRFRSVAGQAGDKGASSTPVEPWTVVLAPNTTTQPTPTGLLVSYPLADGRSVAALLRGDIEAAPETNRTFLVGKGGEFLLLSDRPILNKVANKVRPEIQSAMADGHFGAEVSLLRRAADDVRDTRAAETAEDVGVLSRAVVAERLLYEDMVVEIGETGSGPDAVDELPPAGDDSLDSLYTITVDAEAHEGKTIAVNFEDGLIDPDRLVFRYFNVDANRTVEATIVQADDLRDVLDPLDDGAIAEYWVVEDVDGVQVLVSIPHFSVHKIELLGIVDEIIDRPSLALGVFGAVVVVAASTAAMFRRPEDDL